MDPRFEPIGIDDPFRFSCGPHVSCFNHCCRDLNQCLTPYDILRLRIRLSMCSEAFLARFTREHTGPETGLPVVVLAPAERTALACPFVTSRGCSVYEDRPGSCRAYPLARAVVRSRQTGLDTVHWAVVRESHCAGFQAGPDRTVRQWIRSQGAEPYFRMNDLLLKIIGLKNRLRPGPLPSREKALFRLALYDIDAFRERVLQRGLAEEIRPDSGRTGDWVQNDELLLEAAHTYVARALFGGHRGP